MLNPDNIPNPDTENPAHHCGFRPDHNVCYETRYVPAEIRAYKKAAIELSMQVFSEDPKVHKAAFDYFKAHKDDSFPKDGFVNHIVCYPNKRASLGDLMQRKSQVQDLIENTVYSVWPDGKVECFRMIQKESHVLVEFVLIVNTGHVQDKLLELMQESNSFLRLSLELGPYLNSTSYVPSNIVTPEACSRPGVFFAYCNNDRCANIAFAYHDNDKCAETVVKNNESSCEDCQKTTKLRT